MVTQLAGVGLGGLGYQELTMCSEMDRVEIVAGVDVAESARQRLTADFDAPAYPDCAELLANHGDELDGVLIVTPHALHYEQIKQCLQGGLDVFAEKPMVTDVEHAVDVVDTAAENDRVLQVGYQRRFHPGFREVKRLIDSGRIGDVHMVDCHLEQNWINGVDGSWRTDPALSGGGQLYDSGSHLLDAVLWVTGARPKSVAATIDFDGHDVDVNSAAAATFERDGRTITASIGISGNGSTAAPPTESMRIHGTDGSIYYDRERLSVREKDSNGEAVFTSDVGADIDMIDLFPEKLADFIASVRGKREPTVPGSSMLGVIALTDAIYEAARSGRTVLVSDEMELSVEHE